jgi:hypothetical protein
VEQEYVGQMKVMGKESSKMHSVYMSSNEVKVETE